jgi:hypothetical protein
MKDEPTPPKSNPQINTGVERKGDIIKVTITRGATIKVSIPKIG